MPCGVESTHPVNAGKNAEQTKRTSRPIDFILFFRISSRKETTTDLPSGSSAKRFLVMDERRQYLVCIAPIAAGYGDGAWGAWERQTRAAGGEVAKILRKIRCVGKKAPSHSAPSQTMT
jgi:hypothetical protein